nr:hypothetical protein [Neomicrococcus lactis]
MTDILGYHPHIEVVGEAVDGAQAVERVQRFRPNVVLMHIRSRSLTESKQPAGFARTPTTLTCASSFSPRSRKTNTWFPPFARESADLSARALSLRTF